MNMNDFYQFLNESTYINNVNTGQVLVRELSLATQAFKPMEMGGQVNINNVYADSTKNQSNYMNPSKLKDGEWK